MSLELYPRRGRRLGQDAMPAAAACTEGESTGR
jgi:hypothetical protein